MSRKKPPLVAEFLLFDVLYDDGSRTSNRRVPSAEVEAWDKEASVRGIIEAQDRAIAEQSGRSRGAITSIAPASGRAAAAPRSSAR